MCPTQPSFVPENGWLSREWPLMQIRDIQSRIAMAPPSPSNHSQRSRTSSRSTKKYCPVTNHPDPVEVKPGSRFCARHHGTIENKKRQCKMEHGEEAKKKLVAIERHCFESACNATARLKLWNASAMPVVQEVLPHPGRLVLFLAETPHAVGSFQQQPRDVITMWWRGEGIWNGDCV